MDGNGRWAAARGLPRTMGHKAGIDAVQRTLKAARDLPVSHLTLYSFSSENWRRPVTEIQELMKLLRYYLRSELATLHKENVRIKVIGERKQLPSDIVDLIVNAEELTQANEALTLTLALSYGGRQEITSAARELARAVERGVLQTDAIDEHVLQSFLFTGGMPDPDLIIRTSGEQRISNFLLWQSAYAEFVFMDVLWPDFSGEHLAKAIDEFQTRERRYGDTVRHV
jgi:undecaprenyl diphosphate synthase